MMSNPTVSDEFVKIAMEKGLIKTAEESKELKDYKNDPHPRVGSDTKEVIEGLYGVKPDTDKSMKYEYNIVEDAHPNQVVLTNSYDKLNSLIENVNERNQILINITRRPPTGNHTQKRYAETELTLALVRVANDMDNHDKNELRILADTCITQIKKEALAPVVLPLVGAVGVGTIAIVGAAVLGAVYLYNHINDPDKGLLANVNNAIQQVDDLIGEDWFHQTFYSTLKPEFLANLKKFRIDLGHLKAEIERFNTIENQVHSLKTYDEIAKTSQESGTEIIQKAEEFRNFLKNMAPEIEDAIHLFQQSNVRDLAIKDETWFSGLVSKIEPIFHGGWGLFSDRFDDIKQSLEPLKQSMQSTAAEIDRLEAGAGKREAALTKALATSKKYDAKSAIETPKTDEKEESSSISAVQQAFNELSGAK